MLATEVSEHSKVKCIMQKVQVMIICLHFFFICIIILFMGSDEMKMMRPVGKERYDEVVSELTESGIVIDEEADLLLTERDNKAEFLIVRDQAGERLRIKSEEVIFIESFGSEMLVHTAGKCCKSYERLYKLEQILGNDFLRVSNSALINKKFIKDIRPGFSRKFVLTMTDGTLVDVTRSYYDSFRRALNI